MTILEHIRELCRTANPSYHFEFESEKMMNVKADDDRFPCVFFEEYINGRYFQQYGWKKSVQVELSFMRLAPFQCNAEEREHLRERIEREAVIPFIEALNGSGVFLAVDEFTCMAEPPRFDANAVSVLARFWATIDLCAL